MDLAGYQNLSKGLDLINQSFAIMKTNRRIANGCLSVSGTVFLVWQYALRDNSTTLADPALWRGLDQMLPREAWKRARQFLEDNFLLKWGDQRERPWTLVTSAFSHMSTGHITANVLGFQTFFNVLGFMIPPVHFLGLILTTSLGGSVGFLMQQARSKFPNRRVRGLGMSGVTTGLGVAAAVLNPTQPTRFLGIIVLPLWIAVAGYTAIDYTLLDSENSLVGHSAHLGGAFAGMLYATTLKHFGTTYLPINQSFLRLQNIRI